MSRRLPRTLSADEFPPEEPPTGTTCEACGGTYQHIEEKPNGYRMMCCQWCTGGMMTPRQLAAWRARKP